MAVAVAADNTTINSYDDLKGKTVGTVRGTTPEVAFLNDMEMFGEGTEHIAYGSNAEQFLALSQGKVDAIIEATAIFGEYVKGPGKGVIRICCTVPTAPSDWTGLMVNRQHQGLLNWVNLFVWHQWKNGRTDELYQQWFGFPAPNMDFPGVHAY